jgi:uncharacterized damage-inducible protein DinB
MIACANEPNLFPAPDRHDAPPPPAAAAPLAAVLRQLAALVEALTDEQYTRKPVGVVPSSVGGHVRHSLDHIEALLAGFRVGRVDCDARRRGTAVETDRRAALDALARLEREVRTARWDSARRGLQLSALVTPDGPPTEAGTTLDRELAFVLSHTIHHNSLIGVMATLMSVPLPPNFGYAPSTIAHREGRRCVR